MSWIAPQWLWLLVVVGLLATAYGVLQWLRRSTFTVRFTNVELLDSVAPRRPGWRRHVVALLFLASLAVLVVGLARPTRTEAAPLGPVLVLAIDTSLSMEATDVDPSRLEAAQDAATELIDGLAENVRVGLVSFNGTAVVQVAPTTDHDQVNDAVDDLELAEFTAIGEAIFAALDAVELATAEDDELVEQTGPGTGETEQPDRQIIVMSDGDTTAGRPDAAGAEAAFDAGVPVNTIAFGTEDGTIVIPGEGEVDVGVNTQSLEAIAESTGGEFFEATTGDELTEAFADIGGAVDAETVEVEVTTWFLGLGIVLLVATSALSLLWFSRLP